MLFLSCCLAAMHVHVHGASLVLLEAPPSDADGLIKTLRLAGRHRSLGDSVVVRLQGRFVTLVTLVRLRILSTFRTARTWTCTPSIISMCMSVPYQYGNARTPTPWGYRRPLPELLVRRWEWLRGKRGIVVARSGGPPVLAIFHSGTYSCVSEQSQNMPARDCAVVDIAQTRTSAHSRTLSHTLANIETPDTI